MARTKKTTSVDPLFFQLFEITPRKGDLRKAQIIQSAIDCMATSGIENLTFEGIGERLGLGRSHVAYYFPEKNRLIESAFRFMVGTAQSLIVERMKSAKSDRERLNAYLTANFHWLERYPNHRTVLPLLIYYSTLDPALNQLLLDTRTATIERVVAIISPELKKRKFRQADILKVAQSIQDLYIGGFMEALVIQKDLKGLDEIKRRVVETAEQLVFG
jgi:AcrR family transcriptional regulator